jgi:hypothetical protein
MGTINAMDNYTRFEREYLRPDAKHDMGGVSLRGEHVQVAAIDGKMRVIDHEQPGVRNEGKWRRATLMMTERHAVAYQARGGFGSDYGIAIPYSGLDAVCYKLIGGKRGKASIGFRFEPLTDDVPLLEFVTDVDDAFAYDATIKAIVTACSVGDVEYDDESDMETMKLYGLTPIAESAYHDERIISSNRRAYAAENGNMASRQGRTANQRQPHGTSVPREAMRGDMRAGNAKRHAVPADMGMGRQKPSQADRRYRGGTTGMSSQRQSNARQGTSSHAHRHIHVD